MFGVQKGETLPVPIEAVHLATVDDIGKIIAFCSPARVAFIRVYDRLEIWMSDTVDNTPSVMKLGNWMIREKDKFLIRSDETFQRTYKLLEPEVVSVEEGDASYDGKRISYGGHDIYADVEDAMSVAVAISQYVQEEQTAEYERLYAEGEFFRVHICRHRVDRVSDHNKLVRDIRQVEVEIEYTLEAAYELFMQEILRERTACWENAKIEFPDGRVLAGGELQEHVDNYQRVTISEGEAHA
jgi:hypothetical protein